MQSYWMPTGALHPALLIWSWSFSCALCKMKICINTLNSTENECITMEAKPKSNYRCVFECHIIRQSPHGDIKKHPLNNVLHGKRHGGHVQRQQQIPMLSMTSSPNHASFELPHWRLTSTPLPVVVWWFILLITADHRQVKAWQCINVFPCSAAYRELITDFAHWRETLSRLKSNSLFVYGTGLQSKLSVYIRTN